MGSTSGYAQIDWYDTPLYYDIIFDKGTALERDFLIAVQAKHGHSSKRTVLEPACGSGRLLHAMAEAGYRVEGFDLSKPMVDHSALRLAEAGLKGRIFAGRMESFRPPKKPVALAHCLVSTFKYLLTEADARSHLELVAQSLEPGGIYVLGVHLTDYTDTCRSRERWCESRGKTLVTCNIQTWPADAKARTEPVRSRLIVREGRTTKKSETHWLFRTYNARQLRSLIKAVPALEHVATYDFGYELDAPRKLDDEQLDAVLILRRRPAA